ncbi:MAG TPA: hypothetical protein PKW23_06960 [Dictyoglomaceae bacterium]|nr:hypothetical protein [Dictyoglomaceae bacterium]HOL40141.1 hypothetical protein [Dictyoglomaceae bacterium]HOP95407.1 hypothetical protein [Dictyoglomaceae bacterium]HPP16510.1 hypothetical protein [Dictyoglomaceae bacterium]HPU43876.1 hypothetical protein [Dictyoglomaceae bacterium]
MIYNWINLIIGVLAIIIPLFSGVGGTTLILHIIAGAVLIICSYMVNKQVKK